MSATSVLSHHILLQSTYNAFSCWFLVVQQSYTWVHPVCHHMHVTICHICRKGRSTRACHHRSQRTCFHGSQVPYSFRILKALHQCSPACLMSDEPFAYQAHVSLSCRIHHQYQSDPSNAFAEQQIHLSFAVHRPKRCQCLSGGSPGSPCVQCRCRWFCACWLSGAKSWCFHPSRIVPQLGGVSAELLGARCRSATMSDCASLKSGLSELQTSLALTAGCG